MPKTCDKVAICFMFNHVLAPKVDAGLEFNSFIQVPADDLCEKFDPSFGIVLWNNMALGKWQFWCVKVHLSLTIFLYFEALF